MKHQTLCIRTFGEAMRPCMNIKSIVKNYNQDEKAFYNDMWDETDLSNELPFMKLLLNAVMYRWKDDNNDDLPYESDYMASRLNTGKDNVNKKIIELAQQKETVNYVCDYFEANLIPNMVKTALNEALDAVDALISDDKTLGKTNIDRFKRFRKNGTKSDALFLAEVLVVAICRKNKIENDEKDTEAVMYNTFANKIDSIGKKEKNHKNPFHYLNENFGFYGRKKEVDYFRSFLECKDNISTLVITGVSGSGKSTFMHNLVIKSSELKIDSDKIKWKFAYLDNMLINDFATNVYNDYRYGSPLCLIIDYAGRYAEKIGLFLSYISSMKTDKLPPKIRFALIERQGVAHYKNGNQIYPDWFQRIINSSSAPVNLYNDEFLELSELPESALKAIALDYRNEEGIGIMRKYGESKERFE